jgi:hypothetical protein
MTKYGAAMAVNRDPPDREKPVTRLLGIFGKLAEAKQACQDQPECEGVTLAWRAGQMPDGSPSPGGVSAAIRRPGECQCAFHVWSIAEAGNPKTREPQPVVLSVEQESRYSR